MSFTRQQIADQCRASAPFMVGLPDGIDPVLLLWAMSGNESSFGANVTPRHEPAFDAGGIYGDSMQMAPLLAKFGRAAACSYGPWQLMFCNAPAGSAPGDFDDLATAAKYSVRFLNVLLGKFKPQNLSEIGSCWNAGHIQRPLSAQVQRYADLLNTNYDVQMPEEV